MRAKGLVCVLVAFFLRPFICHVSHIAHDAPSLILKVISEPESLAQHPVRARPETDSARQETVTRCRRENARNIYWV